MAKYLDYNGLLYFVTKIRDEFVAQEAGKGLSSNNFSTTEKNKLAELKSAIDNLTSTEADAPLSANQGRALKELIDAINAAGYQTAADVSTYVLGLDYQTDAQVAASIANALGQITGISFEVVDALPVSGENGVFYLVPNDEDPNNVYDEYIWVTDKFEKIGTTAVDLSDYLKKADVVAITNTEIDTVLSS